MNDREPPDVENATSPDLELAAEGLAELDRRLARHLADPKCAIPWE